MIEVKLVLEHEGEIHLLQQFVGFLRTARENWKAQGGFDSPVPAGGELVNTEAPVVEGPRTGVDGGITDGDLEQALMSYAQKNGTPKAVELLAEFGIKRLPELASKDRARFYAKAYA